MTKPDKEIGVSDLGKLEDKIKVTKGRVTIDIRVLIELLKSVYGPDALEELDKNYEIVILDAEGNKLTDFKLKA